MEYVLFVLGFGEASPWCFMKNGVMILQLRCSLGDKANRQKT